MMTTTDEIIGVFLSSDTKDSRLHLFFKSENESWEQFQTEVLTRAYHQEPPAPPEKPAPPSGGAGGALLLVALLPALLLCGLLLYTLNRASLLLKKISHAAQAEVLLMDRPDGVMGEPGCECAAAESPEAPEPAGRAPAALLPEEEKTEEESPKEVAQDDADEMRLPDADEKPLPDADTWRRVVCAWKMPCSSPAVGDLSAWGTWFEQWKWNLKAGKPSTPLPEPLVQKSYPDIRINGDGDRPYLSQQKVDNYLHGKEADALRNIANSKLKVAREFAAWAAKQPDGESLLLRPASGDAFWFIGDIHGNVDALIKSLSFIRQEMDATRRNTIVFLGDLIDRGEDSWGVAAIVQHLLMHASEQLQFILIRGNHDEAFTIGEDGAFRSPISPSNSIQELEALPDRAEATELAQAFQALVRISPCMCEIMCSQEGAPKDAVVLVTHGGVPHTDLHKEICKTIFEKQAVHELPMLCGKALMPGLAPLVPPELFNRIKKDFEWVRIRGDYASKIPNLSSRAGSEIGFNDINRYRCLHYLLTGRVISFILYAHQHPSKGYQVSSYHSKYNPITRPNKVQSDFGLMSICAMYSDSGALTSDKRVLAITSWSMDRGSLEVYPLPTPPSDSTEEVSADVDV